MAALEVECPVCKRLVKLIGNEIIPNHRSPKAHRPCVAGEHPYKDYEKETGAVA